MASCLVAPPAPNTGGDDDASGLGIQQLAAACAAADNVDTSDTISITSDTSDTSNSTDSSMNSRQSLPTDHHLRQLAKQGAKEFGAKSTKANYQRIQDEYDEFALAIHGSKAVKSEWAFQFLTYTAHRALRTFEDPVEGDLLGDSTEAIDLDSTSPRPKTRSVPVMFSIRTTTTLS